MEEKDIFQRAELLLGKKAIEKLSSKKIIIFGVGGVGSWCAEALVRSGAKDLTIVDKDLVCPSNINRQLMATTLSIGKAKVEVLKMRLEEINPEAQITAIKEFYTEETKKDFSLFDYDYIIDAIDSLKDKALLILNACKTSSTLFSSMGAALKLDPRHIQVAEFWKVKGCPLARALRNKFKQAKEKPEKKFLCVYSDEVFKNQSVETKEETSSFKSVNGSLVHITGIFGFTLSSLVIRDILSEQ